MTPFAVKPGHAVGITYSVVAALVWLWLCLAPALAGDAPPVPVRVGVHPGFGRVVFDLPARGDFHVTQDGQRVTIQFDNAGKIASAAAGTRNVLSVTGGDGQAELMVAPGAVLRTSQFGNHVIIDVADPIGGPAPTTRTPPQAKAAPPVQQPPPSAPPPKPVETSAPPPTQATAPAQPPPAEPAPAAATAPTAPPATPDEAPQASTLVVPFRTPLGVAAFRRGATALVVFDQPIALDLSALHDDPVFNSATTQTLPAATVVLVRLPADMSLAVSWSANAWRIAVVAGEPHVRPINATVADGHLDLAASVPGAVVSVADPDTGGTLLVGTQRHDGEGVPIRRRSVEFALLPTWQGVAVAPTSDRVSLRPTQVGFILTAEPAGLAVSPPSAFADELTNAVGLTRRFDFPDEAATNGLQRLTRQLAEDAKTPPLGRGPRREAVAQTLISLGMGAEAQALLQMAAADDPAQAASPDNAALSGIAATLAHRPDEADGINDTRLPDSDDIALWRAIRQATLQPGSAAAATELADRLPLVLAYPPPMRDRIMPLVAETLVAGGQFDAAAALLDGRKDDSSLDLARGMLQQARGDTAGALATYDRAAQSRDQRLHARAAVSAVELRLATGAIDGREAADRLDKLLYAWRGDRDEEALRERLAELRAREGAWRTALGLLRENEALFPDDKAALHAKLIDMFAAFLRGDAADALAPLELVSLTDENADLLPEGAEGDALQARLADRLLALDLPQRAGPLLEKLMNAAPSGVGRASFGARLAAMRLREGDAPGALSALTASDVADLPKDLVERRTLLQADAQAREGDTAHALATLAALDTAAADEARATIFERANNWPEAQKALADYASKTVPPEGSLDDGQRRTLLRLATAAARAGDQAELATLREHDTERMATGPLADMFRLLTADQVRGVMDLKRSGQEAALARALPAALKALQQSGAQTP